MARAPVSKTGGWGFESLRSCHLKVSFMKPFKFIQEVRREGSKVTWPTSRETLTGSVMVVLITAFAAVFFLIIDQIFSFGLDKLIGVAV